VLRLGTRGSALALAQARWVATRLGTGVEVVPVRSEGASGQDKSRWVGGLEAALLAGEIDLAVHSAKDVPGELAAGLAIACVPGREDPRDAICGAASIDSLAAGARVGTSSLRRAAQVRAARADVEVVAMHGNVDTRLGRLAGGACDAIVLALAGLRRLGREREAGGVADLAAMIPAPGQGALLLEARAEDRRALDAAAAIADAGSGAAVRAERALAAALGADCSTPLGAHAEPAGRGTLELRAFAGLPDGSAWARDALHGDAARPEELGRSVAERMRAAGAGALIAEARSAAGPPPAALPDGARVGG